MPQSRKIAIIGGTGFGDAFGAGEAETVSTKWGDARVQRQALPDGVELIVLARHGAGHRVPPHKISHRANIGALSQLGASAVYATAAVGSLHTNIAPGDFVVLDDFLDFTKENPVTFFDDVVKHTDMSRPYDETLRQNLQQTQPGEATVHARGVYVCLSGPRYETPAEVRLLASWGGSVVGMTSAPEAILCRELGLPYAAVALVTNFGCGLTGDETLRHEDVEAVAAQKRPLLRDWLLRAARSQIKS